jgi:hypothetical protein
MNASRFLSPSSLRWIAAVPAALLAMLSAQVAVTFVTYRLFGAVEAGWTWEAKCIAAPLMGAAFVGTACWVAPSRRRSVAAVAFAVVAVWSVALAVGGPSTWGPIMGALGVSGALVPALRVWFRAA